MPCLSAGGFRDIFGCVIWIKEFSVSPGRSGLSWEQLEGRIALCHHLAVKVCRIQNRPHFSPSEMGRSKLKKRLKLEKPVEESGDTESTAIPIKNLPEKFICMHVKSGTKIRNVLGYALKEFPNYNSVVWTGAGQAIGKTISCVELFKRKHEGLHQVTKLRYTKRSKKSKGDETDETHQVPEIHILLTKNIKDTTELGYQAPGDCGNFLEEKDEVNSKASTKAEGANYVPRIDAEKFAAMGLRVRQKRPRDTRAEPSSRKNKKIKS